ncbi:MAG: ATP-binding cassette domain-containing protein [Candidatus Marinimicrobia bacterium]|nr:ATP-binding cassette domain-containing protein [Candidatus Neomarinimicrobiota bacterium]MCF7827693.1 ATP-binding cassette domain-containing protein [Candidatus Neomarinimicrobiota bacterium]MCF7881252.1 ATP-binding cassette domain-containing protein [Candidatus Neomarinimicrobiota bacterium]
MIELQNLYKRFDNRQIYRDLSLAIPENEITVILGKSGVGKSVLLKHILGLIAPDSGKVIIEGTDIVPLSIDQQREFRLKFGMVFQSSALLDSLTVEENVGLGLRKLTNEPEERIREKVMTCLQQVGLEENAHLLPEKLSGGMKKRAAFARAITMQPKYLLYDEPTTGLDPVTGDMIVNLILKFNREFETTSIIVTHDMAATMKVADRIALLENGQIQAVMTPSEFENGGHPLAQEFITGASYDLNGNSD